MSDTDAALFKGRDSISSHSSERKYASTEGTYTAGCFHEFSRFAELRFPVAISHLDVKWHNWEMHVIKPRNSSLEHPLKRSIAHSTLHCLIHYLN